MRSQAWSVAILVAGSIGLAAAIAGADAADPEVNADFVLVGGKIIDGTGTPARDGNLAIKADRIVAIGEFQASKTARTLDATGLVIAPGFIDLHSHSDSSIIKAATRTNRNYLFQGVTTVVTGNCGGGPVSTREYFREIARHGAGTNVIHLIPHGTIRHAVMANNHRLPSDGELERMRKLVDEGMQEGAWGISTGLIYIPGIYSKTDELTELAKVVAKHGGIYATHMRDEGDNLKDSIAETLAIGRLANLPVHISHLKANHRVNWGKVIDACAQIEAARAAGMAVTADQYPYIASSTSLAAMVIPDWALRGGTDEFKKIVADPDRSRKLRQEIDAALAQNDDGAAIRIARFPHRLDRVGKNLVEIAKNENSTPVDIVIDIQSNGGAHAISFGMSEDDVRYVMKQPYVATASDGSAHAPGGGDKPHPRTYGTFPRKIRYALDDHVLSLEQAVRSATGIPASILGLPQRGTLRVGSFADVVVFDPATFRDASTFDNPTLYATGLKHMFINGVHVINNGKYHDKLAGRVLTLADDGPATLIVKSGRIWTNDAKHPWAEAVAIRAGKVAAVGTSAEIERFQGPRTRVIANPKSFAMPGLIDSHVHLAELGGKIDEIDLRGVRSIAEIIRKVQERIGATAGDGWITGQNWDQSLWPENAFPTASALDAIAPSRPVWLRRVDGHAGWANSEAMRRAGINKDSKSTSDGQMIRDSDGNPTGVFIDGAMGLIYRSIPPLDTANLKQRILAAQTMAIESGLTSVHDAGLSRTEIEAMRALDSSRELKLRVYGMAILPSGKEVEFVQKKPISTRPSDRFTLRAVKVFIDGAMGSRGGLLFEPYADDPTNKGLLLFDPTLLKDVTTQALKSGWQVCTHAIGDRGNALVLDAYESALKTVPEAHDPRLRIEHAQVVRKEDVARFAKLRIIASMQPSHAIDDMRWADARLGPQRVPGAYAWRWFLDAGVPLAFGSDAPVEIINPFYGIYAAITREDPTGSPKGGWHPDQKMNMEETLRAFTSGSAGAQFAEERLGTIVPGAAADLTVIDRDLFRIEPAAILETKVLATIIAGEVVHRTDTGTGGAGGGVNEKAQSIGR